MNVLHPTDHDPVVARIHGLLTSAVERGKAAFQPRGAGPRHEPERRRGRLFPAAGEEGGQGFLVGAQDVDGEAGQARSCGSAKRDFLFGQNSTSMGSSETADTAFTVIATTPLRQRGRNSPPDSCWPARRSRPRPVADRPMALRN